MTETIRRVASLLRVSTGTVEQSESPEAQHEFIQEQIRRNSSGGEVWLDTGLVYKDELTGAVVMDRPDVRRALADAQAGRFDTLVMKSISRLGRDTLGLLALKRTLDDYGVELVALQDSYRSRRDPEVIFLIHADRAQSGREDIARNVRNGMRQHARKGKWVNGNVPFGYRRKNRHQLEPHPETVPIVQDIFAMRRDGWGMYRVVKHLNEHQIPGPAWWAARDRLPRLEALADTDERYEKRLDACRRTIEQRPAWYPQAIATIVANTAYYGELRYYRTYYRVKLGGHKVKETRPADEWISIPCPPIMSQKEWEEAQASVERLRETRSRERSGSQVYLLTGLLHCGTCGAHMSGHSARSGSDRVYGYYSCQEQRVRRTCDQKSARSDVLEKAVVAQLCAILAEKREAQIKESHTPALTGRTKPLEERLADLIDQRRYYRNEHRLERVSDQELETELVRIEREKAAIETELTHLREQMALPERLRQEDRQRQELYTQLVRWQDTPADVDPRYLRALMQGAVAKITYRGPDAFRVFMRFASP